MSEELEEGNQNTSLNKIKVKKSDIKELLILTSVLSFYGFVIKTVTEDVSKN